MLPYNTDTNFEVFQMHLSPKSKHDANPHTSGIKEYVFVSQGTLDVLVNDETYHIQTNEGLVFPGDTYHTYVNNSEDTMKAFVMIVYPHIR